jgi:hypothetical protein
MKKFMKPIDPEIAQEIRKEKRRLQALASRIGDFQRHSELTDSNSYRHTVLGSVPESDYYGIREEMIALRKLAAEYTGRIPRSEDYTPEQYREK